MNTGGAKRKMMAELKATKIDDQGDRVLIYGHEKWPDYHIIAPAGTLVNTGDVVEYDPEGFNFGWFKNNRTKNESS